MDLYLQEHAALIKAADSIIRKGLRKSPNMTVSVVIDKIRNIRGLRSKYQGFLSYRFRNILSNAYHRGAFQGLAFVRGFGGGFKYPRDEVGAKRESKARMGSVEGALAVLRKAGYTVTLKAA